MIHHTEKQKAYMREYIKDRYARRKAQGLCVYCGAELKKDSPIVNCATCAEAARERMRKHRENAKLKIIRRLTAAR